ncbi:multidrug transporter [Coccidioides immitis RMSCC 3703]|uniref:Multidrug transporter n=1 Tax=Coccidioides immitis RMSCC 3703 TaxID=454286 RepID=A0A0J8RBP7_COCIT|nr:multidrug transporter [Coccidioides immitis RMSCC 3703]
MPSSRARRELKASEPRPPGLFLPHFGPPERARRHGTRQLEQRGSIRVGNDDESSLVDEGIGAKRADGRVEIQESDCYEKLGFGFSTMKKWTILCVIFVVQISMNFNTSVYANAITPMSKEFSLPEKTIRLGQMIFLVAYAFGCELWAPWSEELGRWPIMQLSLLLVNIWQVLCALAPSFRVIFAGRLLGGLSSAGGSVTLGMIADMWEADDQQFAVAFIVLSSVAGSVVGPISGGFMEVRLHWRWNFWIQLVAGIAVQLCHFLLVPETRATILLDREAKRMRRFGLLSVTVAAPLECLGLFLFAWSSFGPPYFHWISPMFFSMMIAIANYCIYMATIDYMIASYGPYSASATGGNAFARDLLAGIAALYSTPFYKNGHPSYELVYPSLILSGIAFLVTIPIYVFYKYGPQIRKWSKFAQTVATDRDEIHKRRARRANRSTSEKTGMEV